MKFLDCAEKKYPNLEVDLEAEVFGKSVNDVFKQS